MKELIVLLLHLLTTFVNPMGLGGMKADIAD
jgi:hypothetical protein